MLNDGDGVLFSEGEPGPSLEACLEAILFVVDEPVADLVLAQVLERPRDEVSRALAGLAASYDEQRRGYDLRQVAGGWRFYTREECAPVVERFVRDGQEVRLTQAALETLAVVAYRQPVRRSRVSAVRGVNCDAVMRTLTLRGLVEEAGTEHETGAILYRTTRDPGGATTPGNVPAWLSWRWMRPARNPMRSRWSGRMAQRRPSASLSC